MKNLIVVADLETGGRDSNKNPITQVCMEVVDPNTFQSLHFYESFVKPYSNLIVEPEALQASRVTMQQLNNGTDHKLVLKAILEVFKVANKSGKGPTMPYFVGHNFGDFDIPFLESFFNYHNQNLFDYVHRTVFDTLAMMKLYEGASIKNSEAQKYSLTNCCERMGILLRNQHGAAADVTATKKLFTKLTQLQRNASNPADISNTTDSSASHKGHRTKPFFEF